jgi:hypothetical protein
MTTAYIPLISSGIAGPLGVLHLPRLWQKASLAAAGKLHADYPCGKGYDAMTLSALNVNPTDFFEFMSKKPTYVELENWLCHYPNVKLDKASIYKHNQSIMGYIHSEATRDTILQACGIADASAINPGAVDLNNLDDWQTFWREVIA